MPIVATVTKVSGSTFFSQQPGISVDNLGGNAFTLRKANGDYLGTYGSVPEARSAFARFHGANRIQGWQRRDMAGAIEQHVCIGTPLDPSEVYTLRAPSQSPNSQAETALLSWMQTTVVGSVKIADVSTGEVRLVTDISGNSNDYRAVNTPLFVESDPNFNGRGSIDLSTGGFNVDGAYAPSSPFTIFIVANNLNVGANGDLWDLTPTGNAVVLSESAGGFWQLSVGASVLVSTVLGSARPDIIVIELTATDATLRINGEDFGAVGAAPGQGNIDIGGHATAAWVGNIASHIIVDAVDVSHTRILQTERYLREIYQ